MRIISHRQLLEFFLTNHVHLEVGSCSFEKLWSRCFSHVWAGCGGDCHGLNASCAHWCCCTVKFRDKPWAYACSVALFQWFIRGGGGGGLYTGYTLAQKRVVVDLRSTVPVNPHNHSCMTRVTGTPAACAVSFSFLFHWSCIMCMVNQ